MAIRKTMHWVDVDAEAPMLARQAQQECSANRTETERLFDEAEDVGGDVRYHLLWRVSQLQRACADLERYAAEALDAGADELIRLRAQIARTILRATALREEAELLLAASRHEGLPPRFRTTSRRLPDPAGERRRLPKVA